MVRALTPAAAASPSRLRLCERRMSSSGDGRRGEGWQDVSGRSAMGDRSITHEGAADDEPKASVSRHSVLPSPQEGLARRISELTPTGALAFSTPWVRVPVTAPPEFDDEAVAAHRERASKAWAAGWTKREQRRVIKTLDEDRRTIGARYLAVAQLYPW